MDRYKSRNFEGEERNSSRPLSTSTSSKKNRSKRLSVRPEYVFRYPMGTCSPGFSPGFRPTGSPYEPRGIFSDPSVCRYSVPLGFSLEPVSLPVYPALYPSPNDLGSELESRRSRKKKERRKNVSRCRNDSFALSENSKETEQNYTSLPPVHCDPRSRRKTDSEPGFKRRFSDPGLAQVSSDELSTDRCEDGSTGTTDSSDSEGRFPDFNCLVEEINELKRSNGSLTKQLYETRSELESLKAIYESWKISSESLQPGYLTDAICEIRDAAKMREDALLAKISSMLEENSAKSKEEEKPDSDRFRQRLQNIELRLENFLSEKCKNEKEPPLGNHLVNLEKEKVQLKKELKEALEGRKKAEEDTRRLERLVGILRKKINGVSAESRIREDKPPFASRPVASALERNPFVLANRYGFENGNFFSATDDKEKTQGEPPEENGASASQSEDGSSFSSPTSLLQNPCPSAQVTITGPVTDL